MEDKMQIIESFSDKDTYNIGYELGKNAKKGQIFCLDGDLGVGKTVFTKGFAKGLGISDDISSPTFTIVLEYHDGNVPFYHFDVYRIGDIYEMDEIGYEEYFFGDGVCLIEWATLIDEIIPQDAIRVIIEKNLEKGFDYRMIKISKQA